MSAHILHVGKVAGVHFDCESTSVLERPFPTTREEVFHGDMETLVIKAMAEICRTFMKQPHMRACPAPPQTPTHMTHCHATVPSDHWSRHQSFTHSRLQARRVLIPFLGKFLESSIPIQYSGSYHSITRPRTRYSILFRPPFYHLLFTETENEV
jgi:hypothetical protein